MNEGEKDEGSEIKTEKTEASRTRWFFGVFFLAVFLSVAATFYRTFIARDYLVLIETGCDPSVSACFARDICETEDGVCAEGDTPVETEYYKIVERKAYAFPEECATGSLAAEVCADLSCRSDEADCAETLCSEEKVPEGESCVGPGVIPVKTDSQDAEGSVTPNENIETSSGGSENTEVNGQASE